MNNVYVAYALWLFCGWLGLHRIYLGRFFSGFAQMALVYIGGSTLYILIGFIFYGIWGIWWLFDVYFVGKIVDENELKQRLKNELKNKDLADNLRKLYEQYENGEISKAEFEARKEILFR
ncbi:MAG: NINE protein [Campylobacter sp.]|nr:NINE protein [Campylobacter sp.]